MPPTEEEELEQSCIDIVTLFRYLEEGFLIKLLFIEGKVPTEVGTNEKYQPWLAQKKSTNIGRYR